VHQNRARVLELAGPAGAGKSTLSQTLRRRYQAEQATIWGLPVLQLLGNGVQLVPALVPFWRQSGSLLWDESTHMVRLRTLQRDLTRARANGSSALVFDEGPVFALAWLRGFGHTSLRSAAADPWWQAALRQWAAIVDTVVVLDAADAVVAHRIRTRQDWHEIKYASDQDISVWIDRFRTALNWVLAGLTEGGGPVVHRIRTDEGTPERIAERVIEALEQRQR
jgi:broad-specificity NMP kinase